MRLQKLHIQNFRGFQEIILNLPRDGGAVLIGVNGASKSSILALIGKDAAQYCWDSES